jgi:hypothetical protein
MWDARIRTDHARLREQLRFSATVWLGAAWPTKAARPLWREQPAEAGVQTRTYVIGADAAVRGALAW